MHSTEKPITVVSALFLDSQDRILMTLRDADNIRPNTWELPGGKVDPGEMERGALRREIKEELDVAIEVGRLVSTCSFTWGCRIHMLLYRCTIIQGTPRPVESQKIEWLELLHTRRYAHQMPSFFSWYPDIEDEIEANPVREPQMGNCTQCGHAAVSHLEGYSNPDPINIRFTPCSECGCTIATR